MPDIAGSFARGRAGTGGGQALTDLISFIAELQLQQARLTEQKRHNLAMEKTSQIQATGLASFRNIQSQILQRDLEAGPKPKGPSTSDTAYARRQMKEFRTNIREATDKIEGMRKEWKLGAGEIPSPRWDISRKEERTRLENWEKAHRDLDTAKTSLDSLMRDSEAKGIDLKFGATLMPSDILDMSEDEILQMFETNTR